MDESRRVALRELAEELRVSDDDRSRAAVERVSRAAESDDDSDDGIENWLVELAVDFENDHPTVAKAIRRTADALGAAGL